MFNDIRIKQTTQKIILDINVQAENAKIILELKEKLPRLKEFYKNAELPIKVTGKLFTDKERRNIKNIINDEINVDVEFEEPSEVLGLHAIKRTFEVKTDVSETRYIYHSVRSGNREEYMESLVICGDVNFGAEIVSGGNITVLGVLRGVAHAGANGNKKATIAASSVESTQIRIANLVKEITSEETDKRCPVFKVNGNKIELLND